MISSIRPALLRLFLGILLTSPGRAVAQDASDAERQPPVRVDLAMGLAALDAIHTINASPLFLTPGVQVRTTGRVFAFADARALVFAIPISGSGAEGVEDEEGRSGFRRTGGLGGGGWVRAGVGVALTASPRAPTLTVAGGTVGVTADAHPWFGAAASVQVRGRWRFEAEAGADRNWVEDTFYDFDPSPPGPPEFAYVRRTEGWYPTIQLGLRYVR
ncbi:hypothetical protein [Longimicrobium sp.]|uniref:hypothetical protein n=1 Tax=Longimicrobium sp. TaxID=2029185 RepID=UPI003B3B3733